MMRDFVIEIGFFLFLIGGCMAGSENIWPSIILFVIGGTIVFLAQKGWNEDD